MGRYFVDHSHYKIPALLFIFLFCFYTHSPNPASIFANSCEPPKPFMTSSLDAPFASLFNQFALPASSGRNLYYTFLHTSFHIFLPFWNASIFMSFCSYSFFNHGILIRRSNRSFSYMSKFILAFSKSTICLS